MVLVAVAAVLSVDVQFAVIPVASFEVEAAALDAATVTVGVEAAAVVDVSVDDLPQYQQRPL